MLTVLVGLVFLACGLWGIIVWFPQMIAVAKGFMPFMFACGGLLAIIAGITRVKDSVSPTAGLKPEEKK